jgi:hypothetical protein
LNDAASRLQVAGTARGDRHPANADAGLSARRHIRSHHVTRLETVDKLGAHAVAARHAVLVHRRLAIDAASRSFDVERRHPPSGNRIPIPSRSAIPCQRVLHTGRCGWRLPPRRPLAAPQFAPSREPEARVAGEEFLDRLRAPDVGLSSSLRRSQSRLGLQAAAKRLESISLQGGDRLLVRLDRGPWP